MYDRFGLVLMVTHACNLRCRYCYVGAKSDRAMPWDVAKRSIDRAVRSLLPGGTFHLGFFGGEPLIEAALIVRAIDHAKRRCAEGDLSLRLTVTTNGTIVAGTAWDVLRMPDLRLSISHDGLPEVHDRHRRTSDGRGTSDGVLETIGRLVDAGREVCAVTVVRPDTAATLPEGVVFLRERGIRHIDPTLDVWAQWSHADATVLRRALSRCADVWRDGLPHCGISWFDEKAARLAGVPVQRSARCGFGHGEIAVAPSGNLYPCERLIGEDLPTNAMRLAGHVFEGEDFCFPPPPARDGGECSACAASEQCMTTCRCSNYVRTGDTGRPDGLLCMLDQACCCETARVLRKLPVIYDRSPYELGGIPCKTTSLLPKMT
jgi:uncharacterized protein